MSNGERSTGISVIKLSRYLNIIIAGVSFVFLLHLSWHRWGNPIVDTLRDPWTFYQISKGKVLYRDVFYLYGFFPPYVISFLFKIFGVHLDCLIFTGILVTSATYFLIYRISRFFLNRAFSTLCALGFLFMYAFGFYAYFGIFNFILPYSIASTFFIMFLLCALFFFIKFIRKDNALFFLGWSFSLYFAFLCRIDFSLLVWFAFFILGLMSAIKNKKYIYVLYLFLPLTLSVISYYLFLSLNGAFEGFKESFSDIFLFCIAAKNKIYFVDSGLNNLLLNLKELFKSFFYQISACLLFIVLGVVASVFRKRFNGKISAMLIYVLLGLCSFTAAFCLLRLLEYRCEYRLMPLLLISGIVLFILKWFSAKADVSKKYLSLLALFSVSLVLISRRLLLVSPNHYGFFLSVPALICYFVFFTELPLSLFKKLRIDDPAQRYYLFSFFLFFIFISYPVVSHSQKNYKRRNFSVSTARGTIVSPDDKYTRRFWEAVDYLKSLPKDEKVVVFPEGVGLNFFSLRDTPLRYPAFLPQELAVIGEDNVIRLLDKHKVDYIVIVGQQAEEYNNLRFFGIDYGRKINSWIQNNYKLARMIGPYPFTSSEFGVAIFRRITP